MAEKGVNEIPRDLRPLFTKGNDALARENFAVQKEPADVRLLIDAARAAGDASALALAREWIERTGLVDLSSAGGGVRA